MFWCSKLFVKDELKVDANREGRNFLSDNMNVFSWLIRERSSPTKWNHEALFPVLISIRYLQSTKVKLIKHCGLHQIILTLPFFLPACSKWHHNVYNESIQSMAATLIFWKKLERCKEIISIQQHSHKNLKKKRKRKNSKTMNKNNLRYVDKTICQQLQMGNIQKRGEK